ncbi:Folate-biopterin transporter 1, chloroplastic, partial [Mucuna pruriens]
MKITSSKAAPKKYKYCISTIKLLEIYLFLGVARLVVNFYLKDDLHLDHVEVVVIFGFSALSNFVPLFDYQRRSYLVLSSLLVVLSWSLMTTFVDNKYNVIFCIILGSFSVTFLDIQWLWRGHEVSHKAPQDLFDLYIRLSLYWIFAGCIWSNIFFGFTTLLPLLVFTVVVPVKEQHMFSTTKGQNLLFTGPEFLKTILQSNSTMFYFTTNSLGFTLEFLGCVQFVTLISSLLGIGLYNGFMKNMPFRKIFLIIFFRESFSIY